MLEIGGGADLGQEAIRADDCSQLGAEDLDRDLAVVSQVMREVDGCHSAGAELALDLVAVGESFSKAVGGVVHSADNVAYSVAGRQQIMAAGRVARGEHGGGPALSDARCRKTMFSLLYNPLQFD